MRINRYISIASGISRRKADTFISNGRVRIDNRVAKLGESVEERQKVTLDGKPLKLPKTSQTIILNKPIGVVVSRKGQGSKTIYSILPSKFSRLNPVGRLDKDSSGLLLLTSDGQLLNELAHPSKGKDKEYLVTLDKPFSKIDFKILSSVGVSLDDAISKFNVYPYKSGGNTVVVKMREGRNRQIRRTFSALGYKVIGLHRYKFGSYTLGNIKPGDYRTV